MNLDFLDDEKTLCEIKEWIHHFEKIFGIITLFNLNDKMPGLISNNPREDFIQDLWIILNESYAIPKQLQSKEYLKNIEIIKNFINKHDKK